MGVARLQLLLLFLALYHQAGVVVNGFRAIFSRPSRPARSFQRIREHDPATICHPRAAVSSTTHACRPTPSQRSGDRPRTPRMSSSSSSSSSSSNNGGSFWEGLLQGVGGVGMKPLLDQAEKDKCPVLICPAQLSVPGDYIQMISNLKDRGFPAYCVDLTRLGWIAGLAPSAFSLEYFKGELSPAKTLKFYYEAMDRTFTKIKEEYPDQEVHIIGHSIGGWVARAWLAEGCSPSDQGKVISLTTLGTPNTNPSEDAGGPWTKVDQTRGLLKNINARFPGPYVEGVKYTSVAGTALQGKFPGNVEEMLACVSYLPLSGDGGALGDGIIPREVAVLEGSTMIDLPTSKHSGFVPFPGKAIDLGADFLWYGSPSLMGEWIGVLDEAEVTKRGGRPRSVGASKGWPWS